MSYFNQSDSRVEPFAPSREAMRPSQELSSTQRAAMRAAAVREHNGGNMDEGPDKFYFDRSKIPPGWDYQWKRYLLMGDEDPSYRVNLAQKGWEEVPRSRHPEEMPRGSSDSFITRDGVILMERPMELTLEALEIEKRRARVQVRAKEDQLTAAPPGQFERANTDASLAKLHKSYEAIPAPNDVG